MTHVEVPTSFTEPQGRVELNNDGIGYVESYDFSTANMSNDLRIAAISTVASVCYQSPKALGSMSLYNRLANESAGLPSSSFEFVPVLLTYSQVQKIVSKSMVTFSLPDVLRYGQVMRKGLSLVLLTNLRALISDVGDKADQYYNDQDQCDFIKKKFKVYKSKIDLSTRAQFIRHRVSWQELSRRYVSGKKSPFEFYISPKMKGLENNTPTLFNVYGSTVTTENLHDMAVVHYNAAITQGVKPEEARRVLPQSMYTTIWSAWTPKPLKSFYDLRLDSHAQSEIRELAEGMRDLK